MSGDDLRALGWVLLGMLGALVFVVAWLGLGWWLSGGGRRRGGSW